MSKDLSMKKLMISAGLVLALLQAPAFAADSAAPAAAVVKADDRAERVKYATDFADIKPIREAIDRDIEAVAIGLTEDEKEDFMRFIQLRVNYEKMEETSIQLMADMFTAAELKAMVDYYGSPEGRSAEDKARDYTAKIGPMVSSAIDGALMDAKLGPAR
jgi:hypothetical protein